jgi:GTP-binding protein
VNKPPILADGKPAVPASRAKPTTPGAKGPVSTVDPAQDAARLRVLQAITFTISCPDLRGTPTSVAEVAFAGRSNAGKSSAINTICNRRKLAYVSKLPGRTQLLNYFQVAEEKYLVDLPGYGYAATPAAVREAWDAAVGGYLARRDTLRAVILVMDCRHPLTELDWSLLKFIKRPGIEVHALLTKADKISRGEAGSTLQRVRAELRNEGYTATAQLFSSLKGTGAELARERLFELLQITS